MPQLPANYTNGDDLVDSEINQMLSERKGSIKPIDSTTRNYSTNTDDLGSATYPFRDLNIGRNIATNSFVMCANGCLFNFGDGSDGDHTTVGAENIEGEYNYNNLTVNHALTVLGQASSGKGWAIIRVKGTLTLAANINADGAGAYYPGPSGNAGKGPNGSGHTGYDGNPGYYAGNGSTGANGDGNLGWGAQGTCFPNKNYISPSYYRNGGIGFGANGGGGEADDTDSGYAGAGGHGGGCILIYANNIVITGTRTISANGSNGTAGVAGSGAGGGGGGGVAALYYITSSGTIPTLTATLGSNGQAPLGEDGFTEVLKIGN